MDKGSYHVVLTGELVSGFSREAVLAALARLFQVSAASLVPVLDGGEYLVDDTFGADDAAALQQRLERMGARARVEPVTSGQPDRPRLGFGLPRTDDPAAAGLMHCPACGHAQLVAKSCDECGVVFAEFNRRRAAGQVTQGSPRAAAQPSRATPPVARSASASRGPERTGGARKSRDIHTSANAMWREDWLDDDKELPTEQYHLKLFMGRHSAQLADACQRMVLGRRTRLMLSWAGGAVISPFLWTMYRKMWGWGLVIFVTEILVPVMLITLGTKEGVSDKLVLAGAGLMLANRVFWPAILKSLYCRHARRTIMYMHRLAPTYAPDIDIASRGGTSRTSVFVGIVLAVVVSLLAWSIVDTLHARWLVPSQVYAPPVNLPQDDQSAQKATEQAVLNTQNELLANENKWVATRNRLRLLGQRVSVWFAEGGAAQDPAGLDLAAIARLVPLDAESTLDGWGREVRYQPEGQGYKLVSAGPDGAFGTSDDVEYRRILER